MNNKHSVPLADLKAQYRSLKSEMDAAIKGIVENTAFVRGAAVTDFEKAFGDFSGVGACVGVGNGTDALYLALRALGIGAGDEVITVSFTFVGTIEGIAMTGAKPVFIDVDDGTLLMNPDLIESAITPRTKAIMPVHIFGQPCDMDRITEIATRHNLKVVEDAAQAHGAIWNGRSVGSIGDAACFSFFPGKNLGAYGDGGAVTSDDTELVGSIRRIANHGRKDKYTHDSVGVNSRLDGLQAAVLSVKLPHMDDWNGLRRSHAATYDRAFEDSSIRPLAVHPDAVPVYHLYVIRVPEAERDRVVAELNEQGIAAAVHYPVPLHLQPALTGEGYTEGAFPITEKAAGEVISLPVYPEMTDEDVLRVAAAVKEAVESR